MSEFSNADLLECVVGVESVGRDRFVGFLPARGIPCHGTITEACDLESAQKICDAFNDPLCLQLRPHPNVVRRIGSFVRTESSSSGDSHRYFAHLFSEGFPPSTVLFRNFENGTAAEQSLYLDKELSYKPMDIAIIKHVARGIVKAIAFLHSCNITHGELSRDSISMDDNGTVRVRDYGMYKLPGGHANVLMASGTVMNIAPEVMLDETGYDRKGADVWCIGILIGTMAFGVSPWPARVNVIGLLYEIAHPMGTDVTLTPELMARLPKNFELLKDHVGATCPMLLSFLHKCLHRDPKQRSTATELLNHPLVASEMS
eukprot:PhM_4_TR15846/c0_g1_i1/m.52586